MVRRLIREPVISTPHDQGRLVRANSAELRDRAAAARERSAALYDEYRVLVALFESMLLNFHANASRAWARQGQSRRFDELRDAAMDFGKRSREVETTPQAMVKDLRERLAEAAPDTRPLNRDVLTHEVTAFAMAGYLEG